MWKRRTHMTDRQRALLAAAAASAPAADRVTPGPHGPPAAAQARRICTSEDCPMARMLEAMPTLCQLEPPRSAQPTVSPVTRALLHQYAEVKPYGDKVWGPASWTALEADILSLPDTLDEHEFCMFRIYLALRARYLSCSACAMHFEAALKAMPNDAIHRTRAGLLRWLCAVHNDVNRRKQRAPLAERDILAILRGKAAAEGGEPGEPGDEEQHAETPSLHPGSDTEPPVMSPPDSASPDARPPTAPVAAASAAANMSDTVIPAVLLTVASVAAVASLGLVLVARWKKAQRNRRVEILN
jgi:hypothetical protein